MDDVRLSNETLFETAHFFEDDLELAARRARLLAWSYQSVCVSEFSTTQPNEFAWLLGEMYITQLVGLMDKAAEAGLNYRAARVETESKRTAEAWENYFRGHLARGGRSPAEIESEIVRARAAVPAEMFRG